jgi:hypothetical protein
MPYINSKGEMKINSFVMSKFKTHTNHESAEEYK